MKFIKREKEFELPVNEDYSDIEIGGIPHVYVEGRFDLEFVVNMKSKTYAALKNYEFTLYFNSDYIYTSVEYKRVETQSYHAAYIPKDLFIELLSFYHKKVSEALPSEYSRLGRSIFENLSKNRDCYSFGFNKNLTNSCIKQIIEEPPAYVEPTVPKYKNFRPEVMEWVRLHGYMLEFKDDSIVFTPNRPIKKGIIEDKNSQKILEGCTPIQKDSYIRNSVDLAGLLEEIGSVEAPLKEEELESVAQFPELFKELV